MKTILILCCSLFITTVFAQAEDSTQYFYNKGIQQYDAKLYSQAAKSFNKSIALNPKFTDAYIQGGHVYIAMNQHSAAITNFLKVRELDPSNIIAVKELMELYYNYRQYAKAIELAQLCKECTTANRIVALCYYQQEDYTKAEKALLPIVAKNNNDAEAAYALARTYMEIKQQKGMLEYYEKAIAADSTKATWMNELGVIYYSAGNYRKAVVYFNKAAAAGYQQNNDFKENLGFSCIYAGQFENGEKLILEVIAKKPGNKDLLRDIADAYYGTKNYDKSLEFCQKLMEMDEKDGKALYQAGQCFIKKGQKDRGQAICDKAIELDPSLSSKKRQMQMGGGL